MDILDLTQRTPTVSPAGQPTALPGSWDKAAVSTAKRGSPKPPGCDSADGAKAATNIPWRARDHQSGTLNDAPPTADVPTSLLPSSIRLPNPRM